jgi:hypothetical protein
MINQLHGTSFQESPGLVLIIMMHQYTYMCIDNDDHPHLCNDL